MLKKITHKIEQVEANYWLARERRAYESKRRQEQKRVQKEQRDLETKKLLFYSQFVPGSSLCFDIGANVGNRTKLFLLLGAHVVAVEPQEDCAHRLNTIFGSNRRFRLVNKAVGSLEGQAEIFLTNENTISSMSRDWIKAVKTSGRFGNYSWDHSRTVQVTTLDNLIDEYGVPEFIKIDVEGFEREVVSGLSKSVKTISVEFTPEFLDSTLNCIEHLKTIGPIELNYSIGESMELALKSWTTPEELMRLLKAVPNDARFFGDVYIRFLEEDHFNKAIEAIKRKWQQLMIIIR